MGKALKNQATFFLYGLVFWLPLAIVLYILFFLFNDAEHVGRMILLAFLPDNYVYHGLGIVLFILIIYLSGFLMKTSAGGNILSRIPLVGLFFGKGEVITLNRLLHMQPCLFLLSSTCISFGWILSDQKVDLAGEGADFSVVIVYYPNVPTLVTGSVFVIRKETIIKLGNSSREVIDLLLYGFRSPPSLRYLAWDGESPEDFKQRAKSFGLGREDPSAR
jgi:uncharacterized membrane protein